MKPRKILNAAGTALLIAIIGIVGFTGDVLAQEPQTVRVGMSWIPNVEYGGVWLALENGYFVKENF